MLHDEFPKCQPPVTDIAKYRHRHSQPKKGLKAVNTVITSNLDLENLIKGFKSSTSKVLRAINEEPDGIFTKALAVRVELSKDAARRQALKLKELGLVRLEKVQPLKNGPKAVALSTTA